MVDPPLQLSLSADTRAALGRLVACMQLYVAAGYTFQFRTVFANSGHKNGRSDCLIPRLPPSTSTVLAVGLVSGAHARRLPLNLHLFLIGSWLSFRGGLRYSQHMARSIPDKTMDFFRMDITRKVNLALLRYAAREIMHIDCRLAPYIT